MFYEDYIIHTTFVHNTLAEISEEKGFDLIEGIRQALKEKTESAERGRKVTSENRIKPSSNGSSKRQRSLSIEIDNEHLAHETSLDERKMQQKLNSYKPLTTKEVQVLT